MNKYGPFVKAIVQHERIGNTLFGYLEPQDVMNTVNATKLTSKKYESTLNSLKTIRLRAILSKGLKPTASEDVFKLNISENAKSIEILKSLDYEQVDEVPSCFSTVKVSKKVMDRFNFMFFYNKPMQLLLIVRRAWIDKSLSMNRLAEEGQEDKKLDMLIQRINLDTASYDNTSSSMFTRHKKLQEELKKAENKPTNERRISSFFNASNFAIMLFEGGDFSFAIYNGLKEVIHKSEHKYIIRKKGGGKQSTKDKTKAIKSVGSTIRRENERALNKNILLHIQESCQLLLKCEAIFLYAPGTNSSHIIDCFKELGMNTGNIVSIGFPSQKAKYQEVKACFKKLCSFYVIFGK